MYMTLLQRTAGLDNTVVETVWGIGYKVPQIEGLSI